MNIFRFTNVFCLILFVTSVVLTPTPLPSSFSQRSLPNRAFTIPPIIANQSLTKLQPLLETTAGPTTGPLFVNPDNPRYFTDGTSVNGKQKAVLLTGSHTWCNFTDCGSSPTPPVFNYNAFLDFLVARNHNFFRLWRAENARGGETGDNFWFTPLPYARSSTCCAFDGDNKFDLNQFNQAYFDRLHQRVLQARDRGIYVSIMLFDGWSVESKLATHQPWKGHMPKRSHLWAAKPSSKNCALLTPRICRE